MPDIPPALIETIKEQRAVLFLGSGASHSAKHPKGIKIPKGDHLRNLICDKFLGGNLKQKSLTAVASMAASEVGLLAFQGYIRELFQPFSPGNFHLLIPKFRWRAIATTNFDLIIEKTYASAEGPLQNLVKIVKDGENFDSRLNKETDPVGFYKLHGCIESYNDVEVPIILGNEQYASHAKNRERLFNRFRDLGYEYPIVFAGYSISDPHIQHILFDLTDPDIGRPPFYLISPGITDIEARYWTGNKIFAVDATFQDFLNIIDRRIPSTARALSVSIGGGELSIRKHYRIAQATEPASVAWFLTNSASHVHSGLVAPTQDPRQFYRGYDDGWGCIIQNLDARRSFSDSVLVDAVLANEESRQTAELFMLKGPGGNGKSVSLKRIAWEAGVDYDQLVLYPTGPAGLSVEPLSEIHRLTGKRIFLFVDRVALVRNEISGLLQAAKSRRLPISIIGAERDNEWNIYCEQLEPFVRGDFPVRYLNEKEIRELLILLERHDSLGLLGNLEFEDRVTKFVETAERQLLVALHEATLGIPFEDIVVDEFRRIEPEVARNLYLDICALHQFGAPVRAGLRELLILLERHDSLGLLGNLEFEDRVTKFVETAERQLLVALHEATLGIPFEDIVVDEFRRIEPEVARNLYLDICALHQFGAPVRAGLISRSSGIRFDRFQAELIQPLENIVHVVKDGNYRDIYYRSRHQHVAEILFNRIVPSVEDKFDLLVRLLGAINIDYSSDQETFFRLIKGRGIADIFPPIELGRLFYDHIQKAVPNEAFVLHQRAVFEMHHSGGSLSKAEEAAACAFQLNPNSHSIQHTQAEIARRLAKETDDPLRKQSLRRTTREKLGGRTVRITEYDLYTRAQLAIDEFQDLAASLEVPGNGPLPPAFVAAARETETSIQRGLQLFPESSELLTVEATFRDCLDQSARALEALERAFKLNPRQDWLAARLARKYQNSGDLKKSKEVLEICLRDNPSSKLAHLQLGRIMIHLGDSNGAIEHLRRSFTHGDNNYEAQFWFARELFLQSHFSEAEALFKAVNERAPGRFRTQSGANVQRDERLVFFDFRVERKEEGYGFLKLSQYPKNIFAFRGDSDPSEWDKLYRLARGKCALAFNRRGPRAIAVRLED